MKNSPNAVGITEQIIFIIPETKNQHKIGQISQILLIYLIEQASIRLFKDQLINQVPIFEAF